jgi:hypothetical protein
MLRHALSAVLALSLLGAPLGGQSTVPADSADWSVDPNSTRLFFAPTARPLAKGEGYISSYFLFFPMVAYGVTDKVTLAGGTPIIPGLTGRMWYLAPKVTLLDRGRGSFAVGALGFFAPFEEESGSVGILYGAGTFGSPDNALTLGAGWGYYTFDGEGDIANRPVIVVGGERRITRNMKLVTENWLGFNSGVSGLATAGVRFIGGRLSADLGLGGAIGTSDVGCCLPLANVVWTFGRQGR